jgi:hypothetical protein
MFNLFSIKTHPTTNPYASISSLLNWKYLCKIKFCNGEFPVLHIFFLQIYH